MDKIWYRNPSKSEVIGRCVGDEKKRMTTQIPQKWNAKSNNKKTTNKNNLMTSTYSNIPYMVVVVNKYTVFIMAISVYPIIIYIV